MKIPDNVLPDDWNEMTHMAAIQCPHGHTIEYDGRCPEGCVSPLKEKGYI